MSSDETDCQVYFGVGGSHMELLKHFKPTFFEVEETEKQEENSNNVLDKIRMDFEILIL